MTVQVVGHARQFQELVDQLPQTLRRWLIREIAAQLTAYSEDWRERVVNRLQAIDERHVRSHSSFQLHLYPEAIWKAVQTTFNEVRDHPRGLENGVTLWTETDWNNLRLLSAHHESEWWDQELLLRVPLVMLPKRLVLDLDTTSSDGSKVMLSTRGRNSSLTTYLVMTRSFEVAEAELGVSLSRQRLEPVIRSLFFLIPDSLFRRIDLPDGDPVGQHDQTQVVEAIDDFLGNEGLGGLVTRGQISALADEGTALLQLLRRTESKERRLTWAHVNGLSDPIITPILALPDYIKLARRENRLRPSEIGPASTAFIESCFHYLTVMRNLLSAPELGVHLWHPLMATSRFTHSYIMYAHMQARIGATETVRVDQTIRLGVSKKDSKLRRRLASFLLKAAVFTGVSHVYDLSFGDAQATHFEVVSPEPSAVRLRPSKTRLAVGPIRLQGSAQLGRVFGLQYSRSSEMQAFYTGKRFREFQDLVESQWSTKKTRKRREARKLLSAKSRASAQLRVVYRLHRNVSVPYVAAVLFISYIAAYTWWVALATRAQRNDLVGFAALSVFGAILGGGLTIREQTRLATALLFRLRVALGVVTVGLLVGFSLALVRHRFG